MLSSNSSCNHNPIPNYRPFLENDISSPSKLEDPHNSSFLFSFPNSPLMHFEYQDVYLQFLELFYQQQSITTPHDADHEITASKMADSNENAVVVKDDDAAAASNGAKATTTKADRSVRNRSSKKDRHSKINTARGPRDRRMRLSLDIARKFFDLQDLLGYDKASRTVEWLLRKSRNAIAELARGRGLAANQNVNNHAINPSSESSTCEEECEVVSSTVEEAAAPSLPASSNCSKVTRRNKKVKRVLGRATVARESRTKARERARERTSQKRRLVISEEQPKPYGDRSRIEPNHRFKDSNIPFYDIPVAAAGLVEDLRSDDARIVGATNQQVVSEPWHPSTVFDYQEENAVFLHQNEQIAEFQFSGKPWEAFNSFSLSG